MLSYYAIVILCGEFYMLHYLELKRINKTLLQYHQLYRFYLFTEMIPCGALIYNSKRLLKPELFKSNKVILQLGGSKPEEFLKAAYVAFLTKTSKP